MVAFLTVHKMTKRQSAKKATGAFMAVANMHKNVPSSKVYTYFRPQFNWSSIFFKIAMLIAKSRLEM